MAITWHRELELIPWRDDELVVFCVTKKRFHADAVNAWMQTCRSMDR